MSFDIKTKKGFSLVEVLFTLMVLSVGSSAVAILMSANIKNSLLARNQVVATELAQEGLELMINMRLNNITFRSTTGVVPTGSDYNIDTSTLFTNFSSDVNSDKRLYLSGQFYSHTNNVGSVPTKYYRKIQIINSPPNIIMTSYVTWNELGFLNLISLPNDCKIANKCVSVESIMSD